MFLCLYVYWFVCFVSPSSIFVPLHSSSYSVLLLFSFWFHFCLSHCMFIIFYESLLYAGKVEEDTKAVIFYSKKVRFLTPFYLKQVCFFYFSVYVFFVSLFLTKLSFFLVSSLYFVFLVLALQKI